MGIYYTRKTHNRIDRLLEAFLAASDGHFLSKEDIRQDVMFDVEASEGSLRQLICDARRSLARERHRWEIITIVNKGYRLVRRRCNAASVCAEGEDSQIDA